MTFEEQYLTYAEYQELGGVAIGLMPFNVLEFEARKQINLKTQNRLVGQEIPSDVKLCMFHLINRITKYTETFNSTGINSISSENTDGYSISYNNVSATQISDIVNSKNKELEDIILNDLYGVIVNNQHVIYNGVK